MNSQKYALPISSDAASYKYNYVQGRCNQGEQGSWLPQGRVFPTGTTNCPATNSPFCTAYDYSGEGFEYLRQAPERKFGCTLQPLTFPSTAFHLIPSNL